MTSACTEGGYKNHPHNACGGSLSCKAVAGVFTQEIPQYSLLEGPQEKCLPGLSTKKSFVSTKDLALLMVCFIFWTL